MIAPAAKEISPPERHLGDNDGAKPVPNDSAGQDAGQTRSDGSTAVVTEQRVKVRPPSLYRVYLHNDDYTPMDFVVTVLERFFSKTHAEATEIMLNVHTKGLGICGLFTYEIAETKVSQVTECAREQQHPLKCTTEKT